MAGLTKNGLEIKRLDQVIESRITSAKDYFGNDAGTTVNDVLGRAVRLDSASEADLWELAEAVFNSFNPEFATGASLDKIVAYAGFTRLPASPSTVTLLVGGDYLGKVPFESLVLSSVTSNKFLTDTPVIFDNNEVSGLSFAPITAVDLEDYSITIGSETYTHTGTSTDTTESIAVAIANLINGSTKYNAVVEGSLVTVTFDDVTLPQDVTLTANLSYRTISKIVPAISDEVGPVSQPAKTLDTIGTPVLGWNSVINPLEATEGRFRETDDELRVRFKNSKELNARGTMDALYSNIIGLIGVDDLQIYENFTNVADINNFPPKSFSVVVLGGDSQTIAQTIWDTKPAGIEAFGNTEVSVKDSVGLSHKVSFTRPVKIDVYIDISISQAEGGTIAASTETIIKDALIDFFKEKYSVGDDVIYSRLYTPVNAGEGYQIDSLKVGLSSTTLGTANVVIDFDKIANLRRENITITTTV